VIRFPKGVGVLDVSMLRAAARRCTRSERAWPNGDRHGRVPRLVRAGELLPLVEQTRIDLADRLAQPLDDVGELFGPRRGGHSGPQRLEGVGEVAQHGALGAGQAVDADELPEGEGPFPHLAYNRSRRQLRGQDLARVFEGRFDDRNNVQRTGFRC
jgi:hypothetical protein